MSPSNKKIGGEYGEVRANIDVDKLNAYLVNRIPGLSAPVAVKQFKFGQSNPTYFLTDARGQRYVLRKKPAGQLLSKTAHQVEREYKILNALHQHNTNPKTKPDARVPIPQPYLLCEDSTVVGTPFYVMEFLDGRIFTDVKMPEVAPKDRRECWLSAVSSLARLSALDPSALGLSNFGPSSDYFPRQIKSMTRVSTAQAAAVDIDTKHAVGDIPLFREMVVWYQNHLPDEKKTGLRIVHGDYKLDNVVFHPTENRVIGILDWELTTLGSPLADFANLTQPWSVDERTVAGTNLVGFKNPTNPQDLAISREDMERAYCEILNYSYPIKELTFVRSWMLFRLAIIAQGIAARHARRQASSEQAHLYKEVFPVVGKLAIAVLEDEGISIGYGAKL